MSLMILLLSLFSPLLIAAFFFFFFNSSSSSSTIRLPPGPWPLPIIGNLHLLISSHPHRDVEKLSKTYGPILHLRLGSVPTIFVSSPSLAEKVFRAHDVAFSNRTRPFEAAHFISYGFKGFAFSNYGPSWRKFRKVCVNNLLSSTKLDSYEFIRKQEIALSIQSLKEASKDRVSVDVTAMVRLLVTNMVFRIVMGKKCLDQESNEFCKKIYEATTILGSFNLNDALPFLKMFDLQGLRRRMRAVMKEIDGFLEKMIVQHVELREEGNNKKLKDFVDILLDSVDCEDNLEVELDRTIIKAIISEILLGAMDTSPYVIDWAFVELLRHPTIIKKVQEELDRVVSLHRTVEESDLPNLPYLAMVIKETLRLHAITPFSFRHSQEEVILDGYKIPKGSNIMICIWAMARDPNSWNDPKEFIPERFENSSIDVKGRDFQLLPFGSGRRICPGMSFATMVVPLVLANLVHCFEWELPNGMSPLELDMNETYGFTMCRAVHLRATPIYRLTDDLA